MARADDTTPGGMAAVLGLRADAVSELCREAGEAGMTIVPANLNAKSQIVVSGESAGIDWIARVGANRGAKRVLELRVSAAFHSPLMEPVAAEFREMLNRIAFERPAFPVLSNVTAEAVRDPDRIRRLLVRQLTSPVRWMDCIACMRAMGVGRFAELGPGNVLAGLNRRNAKGVPTVALGAPEAIEALEDWQ